MEKMTLGIDNGWMPDLSDKDIIKNKGLKIAKNVLPIRGAYYPVETPSTYNSTALNTTILSGVTAQDSQGLYHNYAGTLTKLYRFNDYALTDVTRTSGAYSGGRWSWAEYGEWLIATNYSDEPQVLKGHTADNFEDLGGTPPYGKFALMNSGHLIFANLIESGTSYPKKIRWCALEDVEDWTIPSTTGAGSQDFPDMIGNITGIGSIGDMFVVAAENSLSVGYYIGGRYTFGFKRNIIKGIGCYYPSSFISVGDKVFFWGKESIYSYDGESFIEIGIDIKYSVFNSLTQRYGNRVTAAQDKINGLIFWTFPSSSSDGEADNILVYNWFKNTFSVIETDSNCIFMAASGGILLDSLTDTLIDTYDELIDSEFFLSKTLEPMIGGTDHKIYSFNGTVMDAEIETGEISEEPKIIHVSKVKIPITGVGATAEGKIKHRYADTDEVLSNNFIAASNDTSINTRTTDRRVAINFLARNFEKINPIIDIEYIIDGER